MKNRILGVLAGVTLLLALGSAASAQLSPVADNCVSFPDPFIDGWYPPSQTVSIVLPAGKYKMKITTEDEYIGPPPREDTDPATQQSERVSIFGVITDDLHDGVRGHKLLTTAVVDIPSDLTEITAYHASDGNGPNSVYVPSVCFELIPESPPTTEPPTTLPPTTEPPTTLPPTTEPPTTEPPVTAPPTTVAPTTTMPPTTEPPVVTTQPPCPSGLVPSIDTDGNRINGLCQLPPGSCPDGNAAIVPGMLECQYMPINESG